MEHLVRFGVSIEKSVLEKFDASIRKRAYPTRSKAIADLIGEYLVRKAWQSGSEVAGVITMVYDHHKRALVGRLTGIQHEYHHSIISSQHVHLDHNHCLEVIVAKGKPARIEQLSDRLKASKGIKHCTLSMTAVNRAG